MKQIISQLEQLRQRSRALLVVQRLAVVVAWAGGVGLAVVLADFLVQFQAPVRLVVLIAGFGALVYLLGTYLRPAVLFRPNLIELALRAERSLPALSGRLASSVEFAAAGADQSSPLAARSVRDTQARMAGTSLRDVIDGRQTMRDVGICVAVLAVIGVLGVTFPASASTGVQRLIFPYGSAQWPARTGVRSLMDEVVGAHSVHPRGEVLALRAKVTRGPLDQRVDAMYRVKIDGAFGPWQRIVLTHQGGGMFERLVDTAAEALDVYFETDDARTAERRILLVPPPSVRRASLEVTPPPYASGRYPSLEAELGPGVDDRAITPSPSLIGSNVRLTVWLNKPLAVPEDEAAISSWLGSTFGWPDEPKPGFKVNLDDPSMWELRWSLRQTRTLSLHLVDEYDLGNRETIAYRIEAVADRSPSIVITEPPTDEAVLPTAVVPLVSEARDDVAVASIALEAARQSVEGGGAAAIEKALASPIWSEQRDLDAPSGELEASLDLSTIGVAEGDVVLVRAGARDAYELNGERHETARSPVRRLQVISTLEFASQLRRQLSGVRQNAIRIETMQAELQEDVIDAGAQPGIERAQAQFAERIADQRAVVDEIEQRRARNRLDDQQIIDLLGQSRDLLDYAGRAANRAVEAIEQRRADAGAAPERPDHGEAPDGEPEAPRAREADRPIVEAQQDVRDELADLIELLDRDEDTWVVTRQLEGMLDEQTALETATSQLSERTIGQTPEEMSDANRAERDRIAESESDLADRAQQVIDELRKRAEALEAVDPQSAGGMRAAADTAEERELDRDMQRASERTRENQLQSAASAQRSARKTLQKMLEDLQETKRARAEQLLRQLESLIDSIRRLVVVQENELTSLARAVAENDFSERDRAMIRLNQNTLAVAGEARAAGQTARRIARTLDRAADAEGAAVAALRVVPTDAEAARAAEERSLEQLKEALMLAEDLQEQVQDEETHRRREELIAAYRKAAEQQVAIRAETIPLAAVEELTRRQLVEARRLGNAQDQLRGELQELHDVTREIAEAPVFSHVHRLIDQWSVSVSEAVWEGRLDVDVTDRQQRIADSIGRLIDAIEESMVPPDEFASEAGSPGGESGGGEPPLIPPVAELKLLRGMQDQVYDQTADLDGRADLEAAQRRTRLREVGQQQRELMDLGQQMLERLLNQGGGPPPRTVPPSDAQEPPS